MTYFKIFCFGICFFFIQVSHSQNDKLIINESNVKVSNYKFDPNSPSRAAFYSAILPGLGQAYNKKYWKIPLVYGALGFSTYVYLWNNEQYNRYRDAYKLSINGKPHEFDENSDQFLSDEGLQRAQTQYKEDRDLTLLITIGIYALQIVEASVNAHLMQMDHIDQFTFNPNFVIDPVTNKFVGGFTLSYTY